MRPNLPTDDLPAPWSVTGKPFRDAQERAALAHGGVLDGRYVLTGRDLRRRADLAARREGVRVRVDEGFPGAERDRLTGAWSVVVPHEDVVGEVTFRTTARHRDGSELRLVASHGYSVRAIWYPGPTDQPQTTWRVPEGFAWEKNDDYYYGHVPWADVSDVRVVVERAWPGREVGARSASVAVDREPGEGDGTAVLEGEAAPSGEAPDAVAAPDGSRPHYRLWARVYVTVIAFAAYAGGVAAFVLSGDARSVWMLVPPLLIGWWTTRYRHARLEWSPHAITAVGILRRRSVTALTVQDVVVRRDGEGRESRVDVVGAERGRRVVVRVAVSDPAYGPVREVVRGWGR